MVLGVLGLGYWALYPHPDVELNIEGDKASFVAAQGAGYQYRWDVDGDGAFENEGTSVEQKYQDAKLVALGLRFASLRGQVDKMLPLTTEWKTLSERYLPDGWAKADVEIPIPPAVRLVGTRGDLKIEIRTNDAASDIAVDKNGVATLVSGDTFVLGGSGEPSNVAGGTVQVVSAMPIRVYGISESVLEVENAFGNKKTETIRVEWTDVGMEAPAQPLGQASAQLPGQASARVPGQASARVPGQASARVPGQASARVPGQASARVPGQASARVPGQAFAQLSGQASARVPGQASARVPGQASARFPRQASARFPRQASARFPRQASARFPRQASALALNIGAAKPGVQEVVR